MADKNQSNYWLDIAADKIIDAIPKGEIVVSSGISPSASYHIGHFREIMTAEALTWAVKQRGRKAKHIHVVDNFDPLRERYDFLPAEFEKYVGWPVCLVPDPAGDCHSSYAEHYFSEFARHLPDMGIEPAIVRSYEDLYQTSRITPYIDLALEHVDSIRKVFEDLYKRALPADWTPVSVVDKEGKFQKGQIASWDKSAKTINGRSYDKGGAKLDWRLDWPARWVELKVDVEPFGAQEHGAAGGSYDTGEQFVREVFNGKAPLDPARYGHIHRTGETIKMSSSKGNGITPAEALDIMPPEILRYFIVRSRPENKLFFDEGQGLYSLVDEFASASSDQAHPFRDAYEFAVAGGKKQIISTVPFKHLIQVYQAAQADNDQIMDILERTGYEAEVAEEKPVILAELKFVKNWLDKYAPDDVKFEVQAKLPKLNLAPPQQEFLDNLATSIDGHKGVVDGQAMHELIYAAKDSAKLEPKVAFKAIYQLILGKDFGPKAGWFLASLEKDWLVDRLRRKS